MQHIDEAQFNFSPAAGIAVAFMVGFLVFGASLDLKWEQFRRILRAPLAPVIGLLGQFVVLPAVAFVVGLTVVDTPSVALGLLLVACCPGGALSNYFTSVAKGDVATSISMTAASTLASVLATPFGVRLLGLAESVDIRPAGRHRSRAEEGGHDADDHARHSRHRGCALSRIDGRAEPTSISCRRRLHAQLLWLRIRRQLPKRCVRGLLRRVLLFRGQQLRPALLRAQLGKLASADMLRPDGRAVLRRRGRESRILLSGNSSRPAGGHRQYTSQGLSSQYLAGAQKRRSRRRDVPSSEIAHTRIQAAEHGHESIDVPLVDPMHDVDVLRRDRSTVEYAGCSAFEVLAFGVPGARTQGRAAEAVVRLARHAGIDGMVGGQAMDLVAGQDIRDLELLEAVHAKKTGGLYAASGAMGALLAGAEDDVVDRLEKWGLNFGIAFQHADDVLDDDQPALREQALARTDKLVEECLSLVSSAGEKAEALRAIAGWVKERAHAAAAGEKRE